MEKGRVERALAGYRRVLHWQWLGLVEAMAERREVSPLEVRCAGSLGKTCSIAPAGQISIRRGSAWF